MTSPATTVRNQQREWALRRGIAIDASSYTLDLSDNLFVPLSPASRAEFASGDGGELGEPGKRGKMQALHSSSALSSNVFEYWRDRDTTALGSALGISPPRRITFECKYPTGLPGNAPNLDVVLRSDSDPVVAVECKFLEPYGRHGSGFKDKYFQTQPGLWERSGLSRCQELAEELYSGKTAFRWLYSEQLLKHILGLERSGEAWRLLYLWFQVPGPAGEEHAAEAGRFAEQVTADGIDFVSLTYQALFDRLREHSAPDAQLYLNYLEDRYFPASP